MRSVADKLRVAPNALYSHVQSKQELMDALLDSILGEIRLPDGERSWRDRLVTLLRRSRAILLEHGDLLPLVMSRPTRGENALRVGEATLACLTEAGLSGDRAVEALQILLVYTIGFAAYEYPRRTDPRDAQRRARSKAEFRVADGSPLVRAAADSLAGHPDDRAFEQGLSSLVDGLVEPRRQ